MNFARVYRTRPRPRFCQLGEAVAGKNRVPGLFSIGKNCFPRTRTTTKDEYDLAVLDDITNFQ